MKYLVVLLLMTLNCQSLNETGFNSMKVLVGASSDNYHQPQPNNLPSTHKYISVGRNESFNFHLDSGSDSKLDSADGLGSSSSPSSHLPLPDHHYYQQAQAQQPQNTLPTTLSRVIDTKYGKVQGLSLTLFPNYQAKNPHPLRNKIVEVSTRLFLSSISKNQSASNKYFFTVVIEIHFFLIAGF